MKYFRNPADDEVFAYESDGSQDALIGSHLVRMNDADVDSHLNPAPVSPTAEGLCRLVDIAADGARQAVAGDPLRAIEYDRAAAEAHVFASAGYPAEAVPRTVSAWAIDGRTAQQAADSILAESKAYNEALYRIREIRLLAKSSVVSLMQADRSVEAQIVATAAVSDIAQAVDRIGNNR
ncbi:phage tail protein [Stutzerimonas nitrititolerans]|uniref:phage tail protein n=1 Tax=Stutzerimonas nitrititolerans TaxID=2482751 RepID=UPI0028A14117|nr:phage tail protein [Stutzerimonas nitrititolerans]